MDFVELPKFPDNSTIPSRLKALAEHQPDKPAFIFTDRKWNRIVLTRKDIWDYSRKFAGLLNRLGVRKGDVVCNCLVNSPQRLLTAYGTVVAGAIPFHGQVLLTDGEDFIQNLEKSRSTTIILDSREEEDANKFVNKIKYKDEVTGQVRYKDLPYLTNALYLDVLCKDTDSKDEQYETWLQSLSEEEFYENEDIQAEDTAWMYVTSGTTGFSKVVPQTHASLLEFSIRFGYGNGVFDENAIYMNDRSLGWMAGQPIIYPYFGNTRILTNQRYGKPSDLGEFLCRMIVQEKCDCAFMVPFHLRIVMDTIYSDGGISPFKLRQIGIGGRPLMKQVMDCIGIITEKVGVVYGATECGIMAWLLVKDKNDFESMCAGKLTPGVEARIVDENFDDVPVGKTGEILFRSSMNTKGYINDPEKTQEALLPGGWFRLGDVAIINEEGRIFVYSRTSDAIMQCASIYYPGWIESRLSQCPGVQEAILVGIPDEKILEEICACIIPTSRGSVTEEYLKKYCHDLFLDADNVEFTPMPKYFLFVDSFPTNQNGKLMRPALKEEARKKLNI